MTPTSRIPTPGRRSSKSLASSPGEYSTQARRGPVKRFLNKFRSAQHPESYQDQSANTKSAARGRDISPWNTPHPLSRTHELFEEKKEARRQRKELKESGDWLGVQG